MNPDILERLNSLEIYKVLGPTGSQDVGNMKNMKPLVYREKIENATKMWSTLFYISGETYMLCVICPTLFVPLRLVSPLKPRLIISGCILSRCYGRNSFSKMKKIIIAWPEISVKWKV